VLSKKYFNYCCHSAKDQ